MPCKRPPLSEHSHEYPIGATLIQLSREQMQNARENPLAAAAAAAAVSGAHPPAQANNENLLDIDFDGAAPASTQKSPTAGMSGLEGLAGTPQRVASPSTADGGIMSSTSGGGNLDDLMGLSNGMGGMNGNHQDVMAGFAGLDLGGGTQPLPPQQQLAGQAGVGGKKTNEDLLGLF